MFKGHTRLPFCAPSHRVLCVPETEVDDCTGNLLPPILAPCPAPQVPRSGRCQPSCPLNPWGAHEGVCLVPSPGGVGLTGWGEACAWPFCFIAFLFRSCSKDRLRAVGRSPGEGTVAVHSGHEACERLCVLFLFFTIIFLTPWVIPTGSRACTSLV